MSNSPLVTYTKLSPNCTIPRNHETDTIRRGLVWFCVACSQWIRCPICSTSG